MSNNAANENNSILCIPIYQFPDPSCSRNITRSHRLFIEVTSQGGIEKSLASTIWRSTSVDASVWHNYIQLALEDPYRPKTNQSGYNFFFAEHFARLKPSYQGQERAISKRIVLLWSLHTEAEKQVG
ncbi:hypothetical protein K7X08_015058 [Anisodus acutangulus]|uniref:Uncharacterized protein n=1 Tax=Anisodus acutangulus TaxID=402998 RepID=A0A9Q1L1M4_9SOLA|nr:hypothetical protein K7X08_015058 [Anisodus acutangulus]